MITVSNLVKRYGENEILKGISLDVRKGEVHSIIGPSGGGKSTFLRCLNGLELFQNHAIPRAVIDDLRVTAAQPFIRIVQAL